MRRGLTQEENTFKSAAVILVIQEIFCQQSRPGWKHSRSIFNFGGWWWLIPELFQPFFTFCFKLKLKLQHLFCFLCLHELNQANKNISSFFFQLHWSFSLWLLVSCFQLLTILHFTNIDNKFWFNWHIDKKYCVS